MEIENIQAYKQLIEAQLIQLIESEQHIPPTLKAATTYSLTVGGKRLRPLLLLTVLKAIGGDVSKGIKTAAALEMIHTYSLIHDDLPAMDNDDLRRGKPTNHKVFGEATAILAGDSLLTHAFTVICQDEELSESQRLRLVLELSLAAGPMGMIAGQQLDMEAEQKDELETKKSVITIPQLKRIHECKTGCLIEFAVLAGAVIGNADEAIIKKLRIFAKHLGVAFQIKDDILDVEGKRELIGKPIGSDEENGKSTYVSLSSLKEAKAMLDTEIVQALSQLEQLPLKTTDLEKMTLYVKRRHA